MSSKAALQYIPPFPFAALRVCAAVPFLWALACRAEPARGAPDRATLARLAFLGAAGVYGPQGLVFLGVQLAGPQATAIMQPTIPVYVALMSWATGSERLSAPKAAGIALAVAGALVVLDVRHLAAASGKALGMAVLLAQVVSYAVFIIALARYLARDPRPFMAFAAASTFGGAALLATAAPLAWSVDWRHVPWSAWATLAYCCLGVSVCAHASVAWSVKFVNATVPSLYTCLQPLIVAGLMAAVYGEALVLADLLGLALVVPGTVLTVWAKRREDKAARAAAGESSDVELQQLIDSEGGARSAADTPALEATPARD